MKAIGYTRETILNLGVENRNFPEFKAGDTITVSVKIVEGTKTRNQVFEGTVIQLKGTGITKTFTVRKITDGVAVERVFPYYSPTVVDIKLKQQGAVRRAKIYYIRNLFGRDAEVKKKKNTKSTIKKSL